MHRPVANADGARGALSSLTIRRIVASVVCHGPSNDMASSAQLTEIQKNLINGTVGDALRLPLVEIEKDSLDADA